MIPVGNLILSGLPAGTLDDDTRDLIATADFAGYLLLRRNARVPDELAALTATLDLDAAVPRIIAIDEEGGTVSRLAHLGLRAPSAMAVAATGTPELATNVARASAVVLRSLGINVVLGPCLDVLTEPRNPIIGTRSYGEDAQTVTRFGLAALDGYREAGLGTVAKHFPGHGGTLLDSHVAAPEVMRDADTMRQCELRPFIEAAAARVDGVMSAHVRFPRATPEAERDQPATLSRHWLTDVLRGELGFRGVVLSDAIEMQGVAGGRRLEEIVQRGLNAGIDLFVCEDLEEAMRVRGHLLALAESEERWADRIAAAGARVEAWRETLARGASGESPTGVILGTASELEAVYARAVARVGDALAGLPIDAAQPLLFVLPRELDPTRPVDVEFLQGAMQERFPYGQVIALEPQPTSGEMRLLRELVAADPERGVVLGVMGAKAETWVPHAVAALASGHGARVGVGLHRPCDVAMLPAAWSRLLTYGFGRPALAALLDVLLGRLEPRGRVLGLGSAGSCAGGGGRSPSLPPG